MLYLLLAADDNAVLSDKPLPLPLHSAANNVALSPNNASPARARSCKDWVFLILLAGAIGNIIYTILTIPSPLCMDPQWHSWDAAGLQCGSGYDFKYKNNNDLGSLREHWSDMTTLTGSSWAREERRKILGLTVSCKRYAQCYYSTPVLTYTMDCSWPCKD